MNNDDLIVSHATRPDLLGVPLSDPMFTDLNGKEYGKELLKATEDGIWVDYIFWNPNTGLDTQKSSWAIVRDGLLFGSGWYD